MQQGRVHSIFIAPAAGQPMQAVEEASVVFGGVGFAGDRYTRGKGKLFSMGEPEPRRAVTLIALQAIEDANTQLEVPFLASETRRNVVIEGVSAQDLNELIGKTFIIGRVFVRCTELCHPCSRPSKLCGKPGFKEAFTQRGGLRAEFLSSGKISVGDALTTSADF